MEDRFYLKGDYVLYGCPEKRDGIIYFKFYNKKIAENLVNFLNKFLVKNIWNEK